jgi:ankyrin repeat protein
MVYVRTSYSFYGHKGAMSKATFDKLWRAAAEGLQVPTDRLARKIPRDLACKLVRVAIWNDHGDTVLTLIKWLFRKICPGERAVHFNVPIPPVYDTPLQVAASYGSVHVAQALLRAKADVNDNRNGFTPLSAAADRGHVELVRLLADAKAVLDVVDKTAMAPLSNAAYHGFADIVSLLLERKAKVHTVDEEGKTPLDHALENWDASTVRLLLEARADVNFADPDRQCGHSPLTCAVSNGHLANALLLVEAKADIHAADTHGRTPLSYASDHGHAVVEQLVTCAMR